MPYANPTPEQVDKMRAYRRAHYYRNKKQYSDREMAKRGVLREELRRRKQAPCMDCGGRFHFAAMEYDHRPGETKKYEPGKLITTSLRVMDAELAKCDLVCANCHRVRTYDRLGVDGT